VVAARWAQLLSANWWDTTLIVAIRIRRDRAGGYVVTLRFRLTLQVAYEFAAIPLTYLVVGFLKRSEGVDAVRLQKQLQSFSLRYALVDQGISFISEAKLRSRRENSSSLPSPT